jgi:hypothetical protein
MRNKPLLFVTFCAQFSLVGNALCAPPAATQFLFAAGNDAAQLLNLRQLSLPETGVAAYSSKILTLDGSTRIAARRQAAAIVLNLSMPIWTCMSIIQVET